MAMVASGTAPDVIRISGVQQLPTYVTRGLALNLDDYIKNSKLIKQMTCFRWPIFLNMTVHGTAWERLEPGPNAVY